MINVCCNGYLLFFVEIFLGNFYSVRKYSDMVTEILHKSPLSVFM